MNYSSLKSRYLKTWLSHSFYDINLTKNEVEALKSITRKNYKAQRWQMLQPLHHHYKDREGNSTDRDLKQLGKLSTKTGPEIYDKNILKSIK
jgi:hypothetical protein